MKKMIFSAAAMTAIIAMSSCSNEEPVRSDATDQSVTFTLEIPSKMLTRATFGDESPAKLNNLQWTVYEVEDAEGSNPTMVFSGQKNSAFQANQTNEVVNLQLIKGKFYQVAFYADNAANTFATFENGEVKVDYSKAASNTANEDAFVGKSSPFKLTDEGYSNTVTLKRPFAQLNWGTNDLNTEMVQQLISTLEANVSVSSGLFTTMNVISEQFDNEVTTTTTFPAVKFSQLPSETFPIVSDHKTYTLIAMNYLLTGDGTIDCTLGFTGINDSVEVSNVPVKPNYRTNIYGSLLTAPSSFNIVVDNNFNSPDNNHAVTNAESFLDAIASEDEVVIPANTVIDISSAGTVGLRNGQTLTVNGTLQTTRRQIEISGAGNSATIDGTGSILAIGEKGTRPLNVYNGATLTVKNIEVGSSQNDGGSTIYSEGGNLVLDNVKSTKNHHFAIGATGGTLTASNCEIASDSNNKQGAWSYTLAVLQGCVAVLNDVTVTGIQGGVTVSGEGSQLTINGGTFTTHSLDGYTDQTAFYPLYVTNNGSVTVNSGNFNSGCNITVFDGNNDVGLPFAGSIVLKGGKYNAPTYSQKTRKPIELPEGYEWIDINEPPYKFEVVKK